MYVHSGKGVQSFLFHGVISTCYDATYNDVVIVFGEISKKKIVSSINLSRDVVILQNLYKKNQYKDKHLVVAKLRLQCLGEFSIWSKTILQAV